MTLSLGGFAQLVSGCGSTSPAANAEMPADGSPTLEVVAELDEGPGNITVAPNGGVFVSLHQFYGPDVRAAAIDAEGRLSPIGNQAELDAVLGIQADRDGVVWMLDNGMRGQVAPRLVAWHSEDEKVVQIIDLGSVAPANAFFNDLVVDTDNGSIYIAEPAGGDNAAIVVVDIASGTARRVLEGHKSVVPEDIDLVIDDTPVSIKQEDGTLIRPRVGINPIAADADNEWLYYGPMHGLSMYRIRTSDLRDDSLSAEALAERVERWSDKPICDGISMDSAGNIYISDLGANAVGVINASGEYRVLISDPRLSWPDAFSFGPDGKLYTVANQLHRTATLNGGNQTSTPPYLVLRFEPLAPGVIGR